MIHEQTILFAERTTATSGCFLIRIVFLTIDKNFGEEMFCCQEQ